MHVVLTALYGGGRRAVPGELVLPCAPTEGELLELVLGEGVKISAPTGGERKRMLDFAGENARTELVRRDVYDDYPPVTSYRLHRRARPVLAALLPLARAV